MRIPAARSAEAAGKLPGGFGRAEPVVVIRDRWSACKALARALAGRIVPAFCRAHQRRDFRRVGTAFPDLEGWADIWLERIGELFALNRRRRKAWRPGLPAERQSAEFGALQRQLESAPAVLFRQAREERRVVASEWRLADAKGAAPGSLLQRREGLEAFAGDPRVPMDSNAAEATALYDSVYATLRECGVNPNAWTRDFLEACARNGRAAPENLDPWLPRRMDPERLRALRQAPDTGATGASAENPGAASQPLARAA